MSAISPALRSEELTILFDGHCNFCNEWVNFVKRRDPGNRFRFRALQSPEGKALLRKFELSAVYLDSLVLASSDRVWLKSTAALQVFSMLGWPWKVLAIFRLFPCGFRDRLYDAVAAIRYRIFGRRAVCTFS